jgi:hypothetical protein
MMMMFTLINHNDRSHKSVLQSLPYGSAKEMCMYKQKSMTQMTNER